MFYNLSILSPGAHDEPPGQDPVLVGAVPAAAPLRRPARGRRGRARRRGGHDRLVLLEPAGTDLLVSQVQETLFRAEPQVLRLPQRLELLVEEREDPEGLGDAARLRQQIEQELQIL